MTTGNVRKPMKDEKVVDAVKCTKEGKDAVVREPTKSSSTIWGQPVAYCKTISAAKPTPPAKPPKAKPAEKPEKKPAKPPKAKPAKKTAEKPAAPARGKINIDPWLYKYAETAFAKKTGSKEAVKELMANELKDNATRTQAASSLGVAKGELEATLVKNMTIKIAQLAKKAKKAEAPAAKPEKKPAAKPEKKPAAKPAKQPAAKPPKAKPAKPPKAKTEEEKTEEPSAEAVSSAELLKGLGL